MADDDPIAKARLIAAKLTAKVGGGFGSAVAGGYVSTAASYAPASGTNDTVLGKRRGFGEGEGGAASSAAAGAPLGGSKRKKIVVPVSQFPDTNFVELINGPGGKTLQALELQTGARLLLRGKGSGSTAAAEDGAEGTAEDEELHVLIQANNDDTLNSAASIVYDFLYDPPKRAVLQEQQLVVIQQSLMPSPLSKDLEKSNPHTFSLSDALYANDTGFTMMGSRPAGAPAGRREESVKEMEVEADKVGLIIGKGGETIKQIQYATGVYISVNRDPPPDGRPIRILTLKGTDQQIAAGEIEVTRVGNGGRVGVPGSEGTMGFAAQGGGGGGGGPRMGGPGLGYGGPPGAGAGGHEEMMSVLAPTIGLVIGRGGETIRGIQDRTGVSVQVQREDGPDPSLKMIKLVGPPEACARAKLEIETVVAATREMGGQGLGAGYQGLGGGGYRGGPGGYGGPGVPGMDGPPRGGPGGYGGGGGGATTVMLPVPSIATGTIIGRGGEIVKRLEQVSGARIRLGPDQGMEMRDVIISGRPDQCDIAKAEIEMIVRARESGGGVIDPRQIGASMGHGPPPGHYGGGGGGGYGHGPPQGYGGGGYGGGGYGRGPPPGQYGGGGGGGYGGPPSHGGYGGPPPQHQQPYGGPPSQHGGYGGPPPQQQGPPAHGGYGGAPPQHHAPPPAAEEEAPVPPSDPAHFESWWASISTGQQHAYYKKYYPDLLPGAVSRAGQ